MTNLRSNAMGRPCMVRLPGICNHDHTTTVLAHLRMAGITGGAQKAPDILGAWACSACHDAVDRRTHTDLDRDYVRLAFLEAIMKTQYALIKEGLIK